MGAWGCGPLDNDSAADWFGDLMDSTGFRDEIAAGLESGHPDTVRAAAWVVARLAEVYVWPIDHLDADRIAAGAGLLELLNDEDWLDMWGNQEEVVAELEEQLEELELSGEERAQAEEAAGVNAKPKKKATKKKATNKKATKKKAAKKKAAKKKATKKKATKKKATKKKATKKKATKKAAKSGGKGWTRYEYHDAKSAKFWAIRVEGSSHTVHYGRIGTNGQQKTKDFASPDAAQAAADKLIASKLKKGYA